MIYLIIIAVIIAIIVYNNNKKKKGGNGTKATGTGTTTTGTQTKKPAKNPYDIDGLTGGTGTRTTPTTPTGGKTTATGTDKKSSAPPKAGDAIDQAAFAAAFAQMGVKTDGSGSGSAPTPAPTPKPAPAPAPTPKAPEPKKGDGAPPKAGDAIDQGAFAAAFAQMGVKTDDAGSGSAPTPTPPPAPAPKKSEGAPPKAGDAIDQDAFAAAFAQMGVPTGDGSQPPAPRTPTADKPADPDSPLPSSKSYTDFAASLGVSSPLKPDKGPQTEAGKGAEGSGDGIDHAAFDAAFAMMGIKPEGDSKPAAPAAPAETPAPTEAPAPVEAPAPAEAPAPVEAPAPAEPEAPAAPAAVGADESEQRSWVRNHSAAAKVMEQWYTGWGEEDELYRSLLKKGVVSFTVSAKDDRVIMTCTQRAGGTFDEEFPFEDSSFRLDTPAKRDEMFQLIAIVLSSQPTLTRQGNDFLLKQTELPVDPAGEAGGSSGDGDLLSQMQALLGGK